MRRSCMVTLVAALSLAPAIARAQADEGPAPGSDPSTPPPAAGPEAEPPEEETPEPGSPEPRDAAPDPETRDKARELFEQGVSYASQERWGEALEYFRRSRALVQRPSTLFNIGVALLRLGRPTEALRALDDYLRTADPQGDAERRAEARRMLEVALQSTARLTVGVEPPAAEVRVDGERVPGEGATREVQLDPGDHRIEASADGYEPVEREVSVLPGERRTTRLQLEVAPGRVEPGRIAITSNVSDAAIRLDGQLVGRGTWSGTAEPGRHRVEVRAAGHRPFERAVELETGREVELHAALRATDDTRLVTEPVFWIVTAAAVAAVGLGVGLGVALGGGGTKAPYGGNTGVVLQGLELER